MATAFLSLARIAAAFRRLVAAFAQPAEAPVRNAAGALAGRAVQAQALKPLRVVRVVEPSAARSTAGRMVISGRLADVCAELDRLAALEAQGC